MDHQIEQSLRVNRFLLVNSSNIFSDENIR